MAAQQTDLARMLAAADRLADATMAQDATDMPGLAVATVREIIRRLPVDDALSLVNARPVDPRSLIA